LIGPKWIINFPTKKHWRNPSKLEWIEQGLQHLRNVIAEKNIRSIAIPPLGSGNGGLEWSVVRAKIEEALGSVQGVEIIVYEPTPKYQNVTKRSGVQKLTPARAMIAELVRRYWVLGIECSILEIQKLAYFLEQEILINELENPLDLRFLANRYGPYSNRLMHLLNALDGSYLKCDKRLADANPTDVIWFNEAKRDQIAVYLSSELPKPYRHALENTATKIDGFQSPLGMELLATISWLLRKGDQPANLASVKKGLATWPGGSDSGKRKQRLFDDRLIKLALERLAPAV